MYPYIQFSNSVLHRKLSFQRYILAHPWYVTVVLCCVQRAGWWRALCTACLLVISCALCVNAAEKLITNSTASPLLLFFINCESGIFHIFQCNIESLNAKMQYLGVTRPQVDHNDSGAIFTARVDTSSDSHPRVPAAVSALKHWYIYLC